MRTQDKNEWAQWVPAARTAFAEAQVRQWREKSGLPFPNFPPERVRQMRGTVVDPPPGSPEASAAGSKPGSCCQLLSPWAKLIQSRKNHARPSTTRSDWRGL